MQFAQEQPLIEDVAFQHNGELRSLTNAIIMMVDDESITMEVVKGFLEEAGYRRFQLLDDSRRAMGLLEESPPDVLLLDLVMPVVSGFDILAQIRKHESLKHLPVVVLTSSTDTDTKLRALSLGATDFLAKPVDPSELALRVRNTLAAKAYQDQLAYYDPLTLLPNQRMFMELFEWSLKGAQREGQQMVLLNLELDHFAKLRDSLGMAIVDELLVQVARRIEGVVRGSDAVPPVGGVDAERVDISRLDSSIFVLLLHAVKHVEQGALLATRITRAIKEPIEVAGKSVYVTASLGIASFPSDGGDSQSLLKLAASAKGFARQRGGDGFQFASTAISERYEKRIGMEARLRQAIEREEFELHYQPKVDVATGDLVAVEALLRWQSADLGVVSPGTFVPLAEETGLIIPLGEWVLIEGVRVLRAWQKTYGKRIGLAVNLSARQFREARFSDRIGRLVGHSGIDPAGFVLELTESVFIDDVERSVAKLAAIKELGCKLSLDDFGTGYSSLSYLQRLPMDELKIDRSFISELETSEGSRAITSSVIFLAHRLQLKVVAEGVETLGQLQFLKANDCDIYQGFLCSAAVPKAQVEALFGPPAAAV